jgi:hypothetical protein
MDALETARYKRAIGIISGNIKVLLELVNAHEDDSALVCHLGKIIEEQGQELDKAASRVSFYDTLTLFKSEETALSSKPRDFMNRFTSR